MNTKTILTVLIAAASLATSNLQAQSPNGTLYSVKFKGTITADESTGIQKSSKIKEDDLIQQAVGLGVNKHDLKSLYELVYNPATDSIQVVRQIDGSLVSDIFIFQGGNSVISQNELQRVAFVFGPNETNAIGTALITEQASNQADRAKIQGDMQFFLPADFLSGGSPSNSVSITISNSPFIQIVTNIDPNIRIGTASFIMSRAFQPDQPNSVGALLPLAPAVLRSSP